MYRERMITTYRLKDPSSPYRALTRHFALILQMARRDVVGRYRGSFIGLLWSFFNPLLMLGVYTLVFGLIFKSRWSSQISGHFEFAVVLFSGLNINSMFSECAMRAPTLIVENTNFVKKVVFPLETLAWSTLGSALFHLVVSTLVLALFSLVVRGFFPWTAIYFPLVIAAFLPFMAGLIWLLSSLGVFLRDLKQAMGILTAMLMFLAPIFYPPEAIPAQYRPYLYLNPLTEIVDASRDVLVWGHAPNWTLLGLYALVACVFAWLSFGWFERTRRGFADVL
jgi:lipopolysaccharide transport system permease protein